MIEHAFVRQDFFQMFFRHYLVDIPMMATFLTPDLRQVAREESADSEFVSVATEVEKYRVRLRKAFTFEREKGHSQQVYFVKKASVSVSLVVVWKKR